MIPDHERCDHCGRPGAPPGDRAGDRFALCDACAEELAGAGRDAAPARPTAPTATAPARPPGTPRRHRRHGARGKRRRRAVTAPRAV
jgi:hypothetical protein